MDESNRKAFDDFIRDALGKEDEEFLMRTVADVWTDEAREQGIKQGLEQGLEQGREEMILRMLGQKMDIKLIAQIAEVSIDRVKALQKIKH